MKPLWIAFFLLLLIGEAFGYTVTSARPRIFLTPSSVSTLQANCGIGGGSRTEYLEVKTWVDNHMADTIGGISHNTDYRDGQYSDDNNMGIHLLRTALVYKVEGVASYGQRVADLLYSLSQSGSRFFSSTCGAGDQRGLAYPAIAVAYDWCYDQLDYNSNKSAITGYLDGIVSSCVTGDVMMDHTNPLYVGYKTEEPWPGGVIALALHGESGIDQTNVNTAIDRFEYFVRDISSRRDECCWDGGIVIGHNYGTEQWSWYRMIFYEAWESATDESWWSGKDSFWNPTEGDGSENAQNYARRWVLTTVPGGWTFQAGEGVNTTVGDHGTQSVEANYIVAKRMQDEVAQYLHEIAKSVNPNYNRAGYYDDRFIHNFLKCVFYDPSLRPSVGGLDDFYVFGGADAAVYRDGYDYSTTSTDTVIYWQNAKYQDYVHWFVAPASMNIVYGDDKLSIKDGDYRWGAAYNINYNTKPWSGNCIIINDTDYIPYNEDDGGYGGFSQSYNPQSDQNNFGSILKHQHSNDHYSYIAYDLSNAYNDATATEMVREYVVARADGRNYIVSYDKITKASSDYRAKVLWQASTEPTAAPTDWGVLNDNYADRVDATNVYWTNDGGKLHYRLLFPSSHVTMRKVYGASVDQNYTALGSNSYYRFEVFKTAPDTTDRYLQVLQPMSSAQSEVPSNLINSIDTDYIGAEIRGTTPVAVLFSLDGTDQESTSFTASDTTGIMRVVVLNLSPGTYNVNGQGRYPVDGDGVLHVEVNLAHGNQISISQSAQSSLLQWFIIRKTTGTVDPEDSSKQH